MGNYIVKMSVEANSEKDYETFKGKVEELAKKNEHQPRSQQ